MLRTHIVHTKQGRLLVTYILSTISRKATRSSSKEDCNTLTTFCRKRAMDFLKAEIAAKKRKVSPQDDERSSEPSGSSQKYVRRGEEEERLREERSKKEAEDKEKKLRLEKLKQEERAGRASKSASPETQGTDVSEKETFNISVSEAVRRLRNKGEPIRLFGESDKERRLRLRALELIEERGEKFGQNDFKRALRGTESNMLSEELEGKRKVTQHKDDQAALDKPHDKRDGVGMDSVLDLELMKRDVNKVYPIIYYTLKGLMRDWEETLAERPIDVRQSTQGKLVAAQQMQTAEYMKPLFKLLRKRVSSREMRSV